MSLLWWACGEEVEFPVKGALVSSSATGTYHRSTYTRAGLLMDTQPYLSVRADGSPLAAAVTSLWFSCQFIFNSSAGSRPYVGVASSSTADGGIFVGNGTDEHKLALWKITSAQTATKLTSETGTNFSLTTLHRIDMQITTFNNAATNIKIYLEGNSTPAIDWTGDTTGLGFTTLNCFRTLGDNGSWTAVSEIILADEDTRHFIGVASLAPSAAGDTNTWDSGAYTDIDEIVLDDTDMLKSGTAAQEFNCNLTDLPAGDFDVAGVKVTARAVKGASGPTKLGLGVRTGATDNTVDNALTTALASYDRLMTQNPVTSAAWTIAQVNALQACLKSVA